MTLTRYSLTDTPFANRTGRGVSVAVVDSGIATGHPHVGDVAAGTSLVPGVVDTVDRIGHGTAVASVIREKVPEAEIVPVKVFDRSLVTDARILADAIRWAAARGCQLINLSLGTANATHADRLEEAVRCASSYGALVVAALESGHTRWLPGTIDEVVAVLGDATITRDMIAIEQTPSGPRFHASIYPRPIPGVPPERNLHGISFAVANVTGMLARHIQDAAVYAPVSSVVARLLDGRPSPTAP